MKSSPKKITYSKAKKKAWEAFSRYIRTKECIATTGTITRGKCFTCGRMIVFEKTQAGHFLPGRKNAILFEERGVHVQDFYCNIQLRGNPIVYFRKMQEAYSDDVIRELEILNQTERQFKVYELLAMAEEFEEKTNKLLQSIK